MISRKKEEELEEIRDQLQQNLAILQQGKEETDQRVHKEVDFYERKINEIGELNQNEIVIKFRF